MVGYLVKMEHLQEIVTSVECPDLLSKDVHRKGRHKDAEGYTSTSNEHQSWTIVRDPVVEEVGETEEHKVLECGGGDERFH